MYYSFEYYSMLCAKFPRLQVSPGGGDGDRGPPSQLLHNGFVAAGLEGRPGLHLCFQRMQKRCEGH